ncbi:radical SAM family heme chaperone HemW [Jannaschia sp. CCS1]|uniref:radical SAM family heme chaperone HemW n=1 Tax=Jannaschia sp. (strain CCS1) TaxID=290400 RepID=UPI000053A7BF|nr:radical SAM family heme chaperone HemW [Jannaschia sp. CCS1]ABD53121.1 Putative oxygen-independent coproporphyrinogen III oxidase [Jannaschia sp. CCS1]
MTADWQAGGFGLYVHWPFCEAKCPYCDFNSHVSARIDQGAWLKAYLSELDRVAAELPNRTLGSVFFGGGTPSLMAPDSVASIIEAVRRLWPVSNDLEVTLEANPSSVEAGRFAGYKDAGVNRVSVGVQALDDVDLKRLGRLHSVKEAYAAIDVARAHFERMSFDLIYARQDQSLAAWRTELTQALNLAADHLSLYQLTIEPGTAFGTRHAKGGLRGLPEEDLSADMYDLTQDLCGAAGLPAYEVSNHAADFAQSRHNLVYWHAGDYAGIGPGAHGRVTLAGRRYGTETYLQPQAWLDAVGKSGSGESDRTALSAREQAEEYLMMSLRLTEGSDPARYEALNGQPLDPVKIRDLVDLGLIESTPERIKATACGRPVLNGILRDLLA